ncbi:type III secretion HpaP family protein [Luteimonas sp. SDU101]|uniref:type III secretion HpaP family protein n=1 Tax=Luteimonas sp. SDU101 TaxID=3422593 RepID=UPI003EBC6961
MGIDHPGSSSISNRPAQDTRQADAERPLDRPREAPAKEQVDRFRQLMQHGRQEGRPGLPQERQLQEARPGASEAGRLASHAAAQRADDQAALRAVEGRGQHEGGADHHGMSANAIDGADLLAMMQAQAALRDASGMAASAPPPQPMASGRALAEMLERHVRQLAVDGTATGAGDGQVLLRMSDATLPGTDLLLSRTAEGWRLRADVRSRDSYDAIREAGPALARRFAEQNLGTLEIDPHFDG